MVGYDRIREGLQSQGLRQPHLGDLIAYWLSVLTIQARAQPRQCEWESLAQQANARLRAGQPILQWHDIQINPLTLAILCHQICITTGKHFPRWAPALEAIRDWLCQEHQALLSFAESFWNEGRIRQGEQAGLPGALLTFVFNQALHPTLRKYARMLGSMVDESMWYRPFCPVCGGIPDLGALEPKTGERKLLCARCDTEWNFWRLTCSFCGTDEPDQLRYQSTDTPGYLRCVCTSCGKQLPTLDLRQWTYEPLLVVERNLMLTMDLFKESIALSM